DNRLLKTGVVIALEPFISMKVYNIIGLPIESNVKLFSFSQKKTFRLHFSLHFIVKFFEYLTKGRNINSNFSTCLLLRLRCIL
ncbi:hypothetical protein, partial [Bacillus mycoides]|uniref:hypothetical protein n=1 Tax=Bacillus mycoides TaxID=1405 RepID=UPI002852EC62